MKSVVLHLAFFTSGAAALVYEVLWMRRLTLLLGASAPATAATLSALFLGIGLGSAVLGAGSGRWKRPLLIFGLLETGIAVGAIGVDPLLALAGHLLPQAAADLGQPTFLLAARMGLAAAAILPPAFLMGGSLPVLAQAIDEGRERLGILGGGLYAVNTLGAAVGSIAVPVLLLPALGAGGSLWAAIVASLAVAAVALSLDGTSRRGPVPQHPGFVVPRLSDSSDAPVLVAAFLSGCVALALQVLWTRMLSLVHENSVYSFATVVAVYLGGIGAGAAGVRALLRRGIRANRLVGAGWLGAGLWVVATPVLFDTLTSGLRYAGGRGGLLRHELGIGGLALATMLPATLLAGAVLPALMELSRGAGERSTASALGRLLCANTLGCLAGPWAALFLAGPAFGLWWSMALCGVVMLAAGEAALVGPPDRSNLPRRLLWYAAGALALLVWPAGAVPRVRLEPGERLIDLTEGPFGVVAVVEMDGQRRMSLNNYYMLGGTASTGEERLQAHIPLLLHPAPRLVAFLGLGTGITASAALFHPVNQVVAMELVPEVVVAARDHFRDANLGVLDDRRVRTAVGDGRTRLRASPGTFDVIIGDLVVPWRPGEAALYTKESFESARRALALGGIYCQWVPLFQLSQREYESIAATFVDVFPRTLLWKGDFRAGESAVALVGLTSAEPLDPEAIDARARAYARRPDPANPFLADPAGLWVFLAGQLSPADPALRAAPRSRHDRPVVELGSAVTALGGAGNAGTTFVGARLRPYFEELLGRPLAGTPLERLDEPHLRWRRAGAEIWSASLLELQGRREEADTLGLHGISTLPEPLQRAVRRGKAHP